MKKSISLINISLPFIEGINTVKFLPIEALGICGVLEAVGYEVDFRDYQQECGKYEDPLNPDNADLFFQDTAQIIICTFTNEAAPLAIMLLEKAKKCFPEKKIILGGHGANGAAEDILQQFDFIELVVKGDDEAAFIGAIKYIKNGRKEVPGLVYRYEDAIRTIDPLNEVIELDRRPFPAYHKVNLDDYGEVMIRSSRGCPFQCSFCQRRGKLSERSIDHVIQEIIILRNTYNQKKFFFYDQTFIINKDRVLSFCQKLREEGLQDIEWSCTGRINLADEKLMEEMARSGCTMMYFGVESGSDHVLKRIKKSITTQQVKNVNEMAKKYFFINNFIIWGFPFETMEDFNKTVELIKNIKQQGIYPIIYMCSPFPATPLYLEYKDKISFSRKCWDGNWPKGFPNHASREKIADFIEQYPTVFSGFYVCDPLIEEKLGIIQSLDVSTHYPDV